MSDQNQLSTGKSALSETGQTSDAGNGAHGKVRTARRGNPDKIKPFQFKPGQSGNPAGRSKKQPITEMLEQLFADQEFVLANFKGVISGKSAVAKVMLLEKAADRLEGKLVTPVDVSGSLDIGTILEQFRNK